MNKIVRFRVSDWFFYETLDLSNFVDNLSKEISEEIEIGSTGVNYSWELWDLAVMFYVTTTEEYVKNNKLDEIFRSENVWVCQDDIDIEYKYFPKYEPKKLSKEDGNGKYIEEDI